MTDRFGNETIREPIKKKTNQAAINAHVVLLSINGESDGNKCKNCEFFLRRHYGGIYFKCGKFKVSASQSSDWRANWNACGLFEIKLD